MRLVQIDKIWYDKFLSRGGREVAFLVKLHSVMVNFCQSARLYKMHSVNCLRMTFCQNDFQIKRTISLKAATILFWNYSSFIFVIFLNRIPFLKVVSYHMIFYKNLFITSHFLFLKQHFLTKISREAFIIVDKENCHGC